MASDGRFSSESRRLKQISKGYLRPDPGRQVDKKLISYVVLKTIPWVKGPDVLEMGFGDGVWTGPLLKRFKKAHVVDCVRPLLDKAARTFGPRLKTSLSLFEDFSPSRRFDTVVASLVLEHVEDPVAVLRKARTWLKPGGRILVIVPNAGSLHRLLGVCMGLHRGLADRSRTGRIMGARRVYTVARLEKEIGAAGLNVQRRMGLCVKPLPEGMLSRVPATVLEGFLRMGDAVPMELCASVAFLCEKKN